MQNSDTEQICIFLSFSIHLFLIRVALCDSPSHHPFPAVPATRCTHLARLPPCTCLPGAKLTVPPSRVGEHPGPCSRIAKGRALPCRRLQHGQEVAVCVVPGGFHCSNVVSSHFADALLNQAEEQEAAQGSHQHHASWQGTALTSGGKVKRKE